MKRALIFALAISFCFSFAQKKNANRSTANSILSRYDLSAKDVKTFMLPKRLREASGLAMAADGRLFSHDDERGVVYQLDYTNGTIIKQFSLGRFGVTGDFEDIAIKKNLFFLVRSDGTIFEFPEGADGGTVEYKTYATFLSAKNDVEGLAYDDATDCLLLLCKASAGKGLKDYKAVYSFSLKTKTLSEKPRFLISLDEVKANSDKNEFNPSAITRHPTSGTFFIIAAQGSSMIELSPDGALLSQQSINKKINSHPEGIAFAPDLTLILCNDGQGKSGSLTFYLRKK